MRVPNPPVDVVAGIAEHLDMTFADAHALLTDPEKAPAIAKAIHELFGLSDDYDADGPDGLQLFVKGILTEREGKWLDGVIDAEERCEDAG